jgi:hypothetical protein
MSNFDSDGGSENQWDDRGELAWNEFDWERYLRGQDEAIQRYLGFYRAAQGPDRIDEVAEKMHWGEDAWTDESDPLGHDDDEADDDTDATDDVYTVHKNPIFIATKAIHLGLHGSWLALAGDAGKVPQAFALDLQAALHRAEEHAVQAIHALDFGDYAMAVSLFKRALAALNSTFALLSDETALRFHAVSTWRDSALPALFDLREIWLRVIAECRDELDRPVDDET